MPDVSVVVTRRRRRLPAQLVATGLAVALAGTLAGVTAPSASAADGGTFASSFEKSDPQPLLSTAYGTPQNLTGAKFAAGSLLAHVASVTASAENLPNEGAANAADGDSSTKWLAFASTGWVQYQLDSPQTVAVYTLTSANDSPGRDPKAWVFQGSNDGTQWTDLDSRTGQTFSDRFVTNTYTVATPGAYTYYRLNVSQNSGDGILQLADLDIQDGTSSPAAPSPMKAVLGAGPVSGPDVKSSVGFTGASALFLSGAHIADGEASSSDVLYQDLDVPIGADSELAYKIFPVMQGGNLQYPATYVAVDLLLDDGTLLSTHAGLTDQYGFGISAKAQGTAKALYASQWNAVRIDLSSLAGRRISKILVTYDNPGGSASTTFSGWLDDVAIQHATPIDASSRTHFVDTRRGTNASSSFSRGNNIPATAVPNGFNFFVPMTNAGSRDWLYQYAAANDANNLPTLQAIGISHEPSPWMGDRAQLAVMPSLQTGTVDAGLTARQLEFSHADEVAQPDLYSVKFTDGIQAAVTPSDHAGVYTFTFPGSASQGSVIVDQVQDSSKLTVGADGTVTGWVEGGSGLSAGNSRMFVYGEFDAAPTAVGTAAGRATARYATFDTSSAKTVTLRVATSFISLDQAHHNLDLEVTGKSFDQVRGAAQDAWNARLGVIDVPHATQAQQVNLYSDLYRLNLYPNSQSENTGTAATPAWQYASPVANKSGTATDTATNATVVPGKIFVNNGFWDTYRTVWPLYSFLYPDVATQLVDGFVQQYRDGGWIARWSSPGYADLMTGTSSDASFAEAYLSGAIPTSLALEAYDAALKNATVLPTSNAVGRKGLDTSEFLGYTSNATGESVSWGLEGYVNDYAIGKMAAKLAADPATPADRVAGLKDEATYLTKRAEDYVNMFDPAVAFFQGRTPSGAFAKDAASYDPTQWGGDYTETDGWNFAFHAPYDIDGLAALYGGTQGLLDKLDTFFATPEKGTYGIHEATEARDVRMGQLGMSNQVSHHIPYLYAAAGKPSETQAKVREILQRLFVGSEIGQGYPGDEDNGEMSSWYVFSSLGFYPLALGSGQYTIGSPLYDEATVHLKGGDLTIKAPGNDSSHVYVGSVSLDGQPVTSASIDESKLTHGGTLTFGMSTTPTSWGQRTSDQGVRTPAVDATKPTFGNVTTSDGTAPAAIVDDNSRSAVTFTSTTPTVTWTSASGPTAVASYTITNGATGSAPTSWRLEGSDDGQSWTPLDERAGQKFAWATQTRPFQVAKPALFSQYRLAITATSDGAAPTVAEVELLADTTQQSSDFKLYPAQKLATRVGQQVIGSYATVTGGTSTDPADFAATVDFLDGNGPQKATVTRSPLGALQIGLPHAFDAAGFYTARVTVQQGDLHATDVVTVDVSRDDSLTAAFNSSCITLPGTGADCDGLGYAYDQASLAASGFVGGTTVSVPGTDLTFAVQATDPGKPDNAVARGQRIRVDAGAGATKLSVIGTANEKAQQTTGTLTFSDGSTQSIAISYGDWVGSAGSPQYGDIVVGKTTRRLAGTSGADGLTAAIFSTAPVDLPAGKTLVSLTLPNQTNAVNQGVIHVFAIATNGTRTAHAPLAATGTAVANQFAREPFTAPLATVTGGYADAQTATVSWGDQTPVQPVNVAADGTVPGTHSYAAAGTYTVHVTVDDGEKSVTTTTSVVVDERYHPTLDLKPADQVAPGTQVRVKGDGFAPHEPVTVTLSVSSAATVAPTSAVTTDAKGRFTAYVTVPAGVADGSYPVTAVGGTSGAWSTASVGVVTPKLPSVLTLTASPRNVAADDPVTVRVAVTPGATGAVEVFDGTTSLGTVPAEGGQLVLDTLTPGTHTLTATYPGDDQYAASTSHAVTITVTGPGVAVGVPAFSTAKHAAGNAAPVTVTAYVTGVTSGTVTFTSGTTVLGTAQVTRNGSRWSATATISPTLPAGTYGSVVASLAQANGAVTSAPSTQPLVVVAKAG